MGKTQQQTPENYFFMFRLLKDAMLLCNALASNTQGYDDLNWDSKEHYCCKIQISYTNEKQCLLLLWQTPYKENLKSHMILM